MVRTARLTLVLLFSLLFTFILFSLLSGSTGAARAGAGRSPALYNFGSGVTLVPMGAGQPDALKRREAYKALWHHVDYYAYEAAWTAVAASDGSTAYPAGTVIADLAGDFDTFNATGPFSPTRAFALHPVRVALLDSPLQDEFDQDVVWEQGNFEQLFRVYLWCPVNSTTGACAYFDTISPTAIISGGLDNYDVFIVPATRVGWGDDVASELGATGLSKVRDFVNNGGFLYAQSEGAYLAEAAGLVPTGTVNLTQRVTAASNTGNLTINQTTHPLTFSWLNNTMYVLDEPRYRVVNSSTYTIATYNNTTQPGSAAILVSEPGAGKVVLVNGHPSDKAGYEPQVLDALLWAMSQRADLRGTLAQQYSPSVAPNVVPAYEVVPVAITTTFKNLWDGDMLNVAITETLQNGFTTTLLSISPTPDLYNVNGNGTTTIAWYTSTAAPGDTVFTYTAWTKPNALATGEALVSSAYGSYSDPFDDNNRHELKRNDLYVYAQVAARLQGDRDIELDAIYPLPANGYYFDIAGTLENKEETTAHDVIVTDVVALVSPIVDVDDQNIVSRIITDVIGAGANVSDTVFAVNSVFFYSTPVPIYPLATIDGVTVTAGTYYSLPVANATYTYTGDYTYTAGLTNSISIPVGYEDVITVTDSGDIVMPALKLAWHLGEYPGYDYEDPAFRYGLFSQEFFGRQVSFASDPMTNSGVIMDSDGGSVYTNLGGDPIPYHEYLSSGIINIPLSSDPPRVTYTDIWSRPHVLYLRTVFYDIVPFPPPEYHAVVNTTFEMMADFDRDGVPEAPVLEYPANKDITATLHLLLKSHSNFAPGLDLQKDETLISQGMFRGLGFALEPESGDWFTSWSFRDLQSKYPTATELITVVNTDAYQLLYFQQELDAQAYEAIDITGTLRTYPGAHREGVMKINDGARFVYHQKAAGPSRYEVFDSHVQAVLGLSADPAISKKVAPVRVATYDDQVYHFIEIEDEYDPRTFGYDPVIKSNGFGDSAATVYVGGRHQQDLLFPRVEPGDTTQIRLELNNNTGVAWSNLVITPIAPAGITVTARPTNVTTLIEPLFFDFPFLHQTTVPDAWKTVWYFDVDVADPFPLARGRVYTVGFDVSATNLPAGFHAPDALIGIEDASDNVKFTLGQAIDLQLVDALPPWVTLLDARFANEGEKAALESALALGDEISATTIFNGLRGGIVTNVVSSTLGTEVEFTLPALPDNTSQLPWIDAGENNGTLYVVLKSQANIDKSGTNVINYGPLLTYTDDFSQTYVVTGNLQTVEAHGASLVVSYTVGGITVSGVAANGLISAQVNTVLAEAGIWNRGDYIAGDTIVTITLPAGVTVSSTKPTALQIGSGFAVFALGDIAPGSTSVVMLELVFTPASADAPDWEVIRRSNGWFINEFSGDVVNRKIGDQLILGAGSVQTYKMYLPILFKQAGQYFP